jgi:type II secretory pathway pseudopilin PulG
MGLADRAARMRRDEDGMTMIEVLVAALILIVSSLAVLGIVDAATRNDYRAEQSQVVNDVLQQQLEKIRLLPYDEVALTEQPLSSSNANDPNSRVSGTQFNIRRTDSPLKDLVYNGGASQKPGEDTVSEGVIQPTDPASPTTAGDFPSRFTSGDVSGTIYRYVVWDQCSDVTLPCTGYLKRVVVAVKLDPTAAGGIRPYQEIQGQVMDPKAQPPDNPTCQPSDISCNATPWTFWLTDTPCGGIDERQVSVAGEILDDHRTHNTRGTCDAATTSHPKFGNDPGPPDLMVANAPPAATEERPLSDFSTDVEPCDVATLGLNCSAQDPELPQDKGLQLIEWRTCDVASGLVATTAQDPDADSQMFQEAHKWVSPPMPDGTDVVLTGNGNLNLWTRTVSDTATDAPGEICVFVFTRQLDPETNTPVDTPAANLELNNVEYFTYQDPSWPSRGWQEISIPLHFDLGVDLTADTRLGLAVSVDPGSDNGGLEFMYDEPSFESRLQVLMTGTPPF